MQIRRRIVAPRNYEDTVKGIAELVSPLESKTGVIGPKSRPNRLDRLLPTGVLRTRGKKHDLILARDSVISVAGFGTKQYGETGSFPLKPLWQF